MPETPKRPNQFRVMGDRRFGSQSGVPMMGSGA
jgi:hypothetical protein